MTAYQIKDANGVIRTFNSNDNPATADKQDSIITSLASVVAGLEKLAPVTAHEAVTPHDDTVLTGVRALYIGSGGFITVTVGGVDVIYTVPDGARLEVEAQKVKASGTDADDIVAWK